MVTVSTGSPGFSPSSLRANFKQKTHIILISFLGICIVWSVAYPYLFDMQVSKTIEAISNTHATALQGIEMVRIKLKQEKDAKMKLEEQLEKIRAATSKKSKSAVSDEDKVKAKRKAAKEKKRKFLAKFRRKHNSAPTQAPFIEPIMLLNSTDSIRDYNGSVHDHIHPLGKRGYSSSIPKDMENPHFHSYMICNGISNQQLIHAANIAYAIAQKKDGVNIPNAFIVDGTQHPDDSGGLGDVIPTEANSVKLSKVFDTDGLIRMLDKQYGLKAKLVPPNPKLTECQWLETLMEADDVVVNEVISKFKPSKYSNKIVNSILKLALGEKNKIEDGVCLHHRGGPDWVDHCKIWTQIPDGVWRKNCMEEGNKDLHEVVTHRTRKGQWLYYVGDEDDIPSQLKARFTITSKEELLGIDMFTEDARNGPSIGSGRDLKALIDTLVCNSLPYFIGNSVSTWSAIQLAQRKIQAAWYNSRSIPLSPLWKVYDVPIVYTYTEESSPEVKELMKVSILSVLEQMPKSHIQVLYHAKKKPDTKFQKWLRGKGITIYDHNPTWKEKIEDMRLNSDSKAVLDPEYRTTLTHAGDFFGTWQKIDLPDFIFSEYCLLLQYDTVIMKPFTLIDFGLQIAGSIAFSGYPNESDMEATDGGVMIMNMPKLRENFAKFHKFIFQSDGEFDKLPYSPEGAYRSMYRCNFLDRKFSFKTYWKSPSSWKKTFIVHLRGTNPYDLIDFYTSERDCKTFQSPKRTTGKTKYKELPERTDDKEVAESRRLSRRLTERRNNRYRDDDQGRNRRMTYYKDEDVVGPKSNRNDDDRVRSRYQDDTENVERKDRNYDDSKARRNGRYRDDYYKAGRNDRNRDDDYKAGRNGRNRDDDYKEGRNGRYRGYDESGKTNKFIRDDGIENTYENEDTRFGREGRGRDDYLKTGLKGKYTNDEDEVDRWDRDRYDEVKSGISNIQYRDEEDETGHMSRYDDEESRKRAKEHKKKNRKVDCAEARDQSQCSIMCRNYEDDMEFLLPSLRVFALALISDDESESETKIIQTFCSARYGDTDSDTSVEDYNVIKLTTNNNNMDKKNDTSSTSIKRTTQEANGPMTKCTSLLETLITLSPTDFLSIENFFTSSKKTGVDVSYYQQDTSNVV